MMLNFLYFLKSRSILWFLTLENIENGFRKKIWNWFHILLSWNNFYNIKLYFYLNGYCKHATCLPPQAHGRAVATTKEAQCARYVWTWAMRRKGYSRNSGLSGSFWAGLSSCECVISDLGRRLATAAVGEDGGGGRRNCRRFVGNEDEAA